MSGPLRVLHLEDDPRDTELMEAALRSDGIECDVVRVDTRDAFVNRLDSGEPDVIISDVSVPGFDGISAQQVWQQRRPAIPFIFLSGTFGEDVAIERLRAGATDYVLKNWLEKLPGVVRRALREMQERHDRLEAQSELRKVNIELEQRVEQRTTELAHANDALAESERRFFDILDHSPVSIYMKDLQGRYMFVNRRCQEVMGRPRHEVLGKYDHDLFAPRLADMYRVNDAKVMDAGGSLEFEEIGVDEGQTKIFYSSKFPLRDTRGTLYALCGISTDITERKQGEEAMKLAQKEAERANRAKSDFLSRMSHDLRTPLNAVLGFAQLLDMDNLTPDQRESVLQILEAGRHLLDLMNEVLDIARIESGHLSLSPEPVSVGEIVEQVIKLVRPIAVARGISIESQASAAAERHVRADRQRLTQILLNLVSNAIKYNRERGSVTVGCEDRPGGNVRISVTDTGPGIRPEKLALLFKPFERLGAEQTNVEGTGLGLALSRGLAEAMGGKLGVETQTDVGSTFWVELVATAAGSSVKTAPSLSPITAGIQPMTGTILYIEDNASNVRLVERLLRAKRPGMTLLNAPDGEIGFSMALERQPDLIFLDLHLPDTPGEEILRRLWAEPRTRDIPVAVLSADATLSQNHRLMASGAMAYLTKPIDVAQLLALLDANFGART